MSELNDLTESAVELSGAEPHDAPWPDDTAPIGDAAVDSTLERLADIPSLPVAEHSGMYAEIHDSLMAALDAEER
ncbi:hypothetical protein OOZ51_09400 [Arthrobacter sp. MI7-26]|uniref:hypothetical protein n=1 Tax=Arthrobacter sp. MI7-26 TaxID=2993653 RepID=UPI002248B10E|nr:hypothetical protein [Arthrobacter sp. MI7-26]MCX2748034.1 hypothetical protein [Arthrobacter sp. MI7-26]